MKKEDEIELDRLTNMLRSIDEQLGPSSSLREALMKASLALIHAYLHGHRSRIEEQFNTIGSPLTEEQIAKLRSLGIEVDKNKT